MPTLFSVERVAEQLERWKFPVAPIDRGLAMEDKSGRTELLVEDVEVTTLDGHRIREIVRVVRPMPQLRGQIDEEFASRWNVYAGLTALLAETAHEPPALFAKFSVAEADKDAAAEFYPWLAAAAAYSMPGLASYLEPGEPSARAFLAGAAPPDVSFFGIEDVAPSCGEADFAEALSWATRRRFFANGGPSGLTVEFPWDEGALTALARAYGYGRGSLEGLDEDERRHELALGGDTALLTLDASARNPLFGRGLLGLLRLPVIIKPADASRIADELNRWERNYVDTVPTLGAWAPDRSLRGLAFACFFPGVFAGPRLPHSLTCWMAGRAWASRQWLTDAGLSQPMRLVDR
jgi:hypothetical protein